MSNDRFGEPTEPDITCSCTLGWLTPDVEGRPRPCPKCKAHLIRATTVDGHTRWTVNQNKRGPHG